MSCILRDIKGVSEKNTRDNILVKVSRTVL
jgi:hypothetical protein